MIYTEHDLDNKLIKQLKKTGNVYKIDTKIGFGLPDVYYVGDLAFWVEDKIIKTPNCKISFQPGQCSWLVENFLVAKTFILLYIKRTKQYLLYCGCDARKLRDKEPCEPLVRTLKFHEIIGELLNGKELRKRIGQSKIW